MGFFKAFRHQHEATRYENVYTNDNFDMVNAALIYVFSALALSFIILLPGFMKKEVRTYLYYKDCMISIFFFAFFFVRLVIFV